MNIRSEQGFSYIDVMIAIVILMVGILALMAGMSASVLQAKGQEQQMIAKQTAASTMESIMSVKETDPARLGWPAVGNVGSNIVSGVPRGIFIVGMQNVRPDAGADEVLGTADDTGTPATALQRQIIITDVCDPERPSYNCPTPGPSVVRIRSVQVIVRYFVGALPRQEQLTTVLTDYAVVETP
jgi:type II secretory pathway pseudopilin PulG